MIETEIDNMEQDITTRLSYQGMNLDQYLQMVGKTKQEFRDLCIDNSNINISIIKEEIIKTNNITNNYTNINILRLIDYYYINIK